ncbi:response regulator transcription factor [Radiobacillus kanasensis]|uniref:response regulator n=1 Tax=Radiobacillus kanasensis TaxID=2844358 RepID=UPI001E651F79|nr:response regulator transcription factor [Radiobacillus kanasensis]UFU00407.1 response regulator transcription factor [Radiobacillus kanasensis]
MTIKLLLADDHQVVRKGLVFFFQTQNDMEVLGEVSSGKEVITFLESQEVDVLLLDIQMPEMDGIEAASQIKQQFPEVKIVILTSFSDYDTVIPAVKAGVEGYQLKTIDPDDLADVIRAVHNGENAIDPQAAKELIRHVSTGNASEEQHRLQELTNRELDVLKEIMKGKSNKEIASSLFITEKTVKTHVSNVLAKLEVHDRTQAALFGIKYVSNK